MKTILALTLLLITSLPLLAQDILVDDFTTGGSPILMYQGGDNWASWPGDPNHLIGGVRDFRGYAIGVNPLGQVSTFQFRPDPGPGGNSMYIHNGAFYARPRTELWYGLTNPLHLDLRSYRDDPNGVVRFKFKGLSGVLNFNVEFFDTKNDYAQNACNINGIDRDFVLDIPVSKFTSDDKFDIGSVHRMVVITQQGNAVGGVAFAISSIAISNTPYPGAYLCTWGR